MVYHNKLLCAFKEHSSGIVVYVKQDEDTREFALEVLHRDGTRTIVRTSYTLSSVMRECAETIAQFSGNFANWDKL